MKTPDKIPTDLSDLINLEFKTPLAAAVGSIAIGVAFLRDEHDQPMHVVDIAIVDEPGIGHYDQAAHDQHSVILGRTNARLMDAPMWRQFLDAVATGELNIPGDDIGEVSPALDAVEVA